MGDVVVMKVLAVVVLVVEVLAVVVLVVGVVAVVVLVVKVLAVVILGDSTDFLDMILLMTQYLKDNKEINDFIIERGGDNNIHMNSNKSVPESLFITNINYYMFMLFN